MPSKSTSGTTNYFEYFNIFVTKPMPSKTLPEPAITSSILVFLFLSKFLLFHPAFSPKPQKSSKTSFLRKRRVERLICFFEHIMTRLFLTADYLHGLLTSLPDSKKRREEFWTNILDQPAFEKTKNISFSISWPDYFWQRISYADFLQASPTPKNAREVFWTNILD